MIFYKLISIAASILLLVAGWVVLCFVKNRVADPAAPRQQTRSAVVPNPAAVSAVGLSEPGQAQVRRLSKPVKLVYSCSADREYYHTSTHIPRQCERTALSADAAFERNLKPCKTCMTE